MIARLRRRHLRAFFTVAPLTGLGLFLALDAREGRRVEGANTALEAARTAAIGGVAGSVASPDGVLPDGTLADGAGEDLAPIWSRDDLWSGATLRTSLFPERSGADEAVWIELAPREPLRRPDVLVYWLPDDAAAPQGPLDARLDAAQLLGAFPGAAPRRFRLRLEDAPGAGRLLLYSLAQAEEVAGARFPDGLLAVAGSGNAPPK